MVKKLKVIIFTLLAGGCLCLGACGQEKEPVEPSGGDSQSSQQGQPDDEDSDWRTDWEKYKQHFGIEISELDPSREEVPENVVVVGARRGNYLNISEQIKAFNQAQSDYKVEVKAYETIDDMMLDLVRGQGCDLLVLSPYYLTALSDKGGLEDLSPYLDKSEKVSRKDLFGAVLEAGTADGKLAGILPGFTVNAILVEKGYTENGGWTIEEYLALMDKHPEVPLIRCGDPQDVTGWLLSDLFALMESFVDWEERTCSFESEDFIQAIEMVKDYAKRFRKTDADIYKRPVEMLSGGQIQTAQIIIEYGEYFSEYQDIRDAFLGAYELAGYPNEEGEARYPMNWLQRTLYCMNAASAKKDAAWAFLEYVLSDYQETMADGRSQEFPVRRDIVERKLQEETEAELTDDYYRENVYTGEMVPKRGNFTQEDKEMVLYLLDHVSPPTSLQAGEVFWTIMKEEMDAFLAGDKTAEETAHIIQNRVTTYLSE